MIAETQNPVLARFRWDDARVLLALLRAGTLSGAAERLAVNPSTVSRRLESLEDSLGAHLFDRTPEGVKPTAAAEQLYPFAEELERAAVDLSHAVAGLESEPEGLVRLTAPPGVVDQMLAPAIAELSRRHPKLRLEIDASIGYADLTRREADLALRAQRPTSGDLVARKLAEAHGVPMTSPAYARELGRLRDFADARWVTYGPELAHIPDASWVLQQVPEAQIPVRTSSLTGQLSLAAAGVGVVLAPPVLQGGLDLVPVTLARPLLASMKPLPPAALWLVGHRALRQVPRVQVVWDFLVEEGERWRAAVTDSR
jgi:DNA-binding transcriptional LysR family regulator